jgi:hypothetical protein
MEEKIPAIYETLKQLTLDFVNCKRNRRQTVADLRQKVDANFVYGLKDQDFISDVFASLDHLTEKGFATSSDEMKYMAECFEGKREFSRTEARRFIVGPFQDQNPPA